MKLSWFWGKIHKINKPLVRLRKKRKLKQIKSEMKEKNMTTNTTEMQRIKGGYYV